MKNFWTKLDIAALIVKVADFSQVINSEKFKGVVQKAKEAVRQKKIKVTPENLDHAVYISERIARDGIEKTANALRQTEQAA